MEESERIAEERKNKVKEKISNWWKDPYNKIFVGIFILAVIVRFYFFFVTVDQPVWWDSADYLTEAKVIGSGLNIDYHFNPRRTFLLPLIWGMLFKLGFTEVALHYFELMLSILAIPAMYLLGKEIFDKKIALISSFLLTVFWMFLFYSNRLMTEVPTLTLLLFSTYFFWRGYVKKEHKFLIWFGVFLGLAFLARAGTFVMFAIFPFFLIMTDKLKFLKNKNLWIGVLCTILLMSSFFTFIYFKEHINPIAEFLAFTPQSTTGAETRFTNMMGLSGIPKYLQLMPVYFGWILLVPFILGMLIILFNLVVRFDLIMKEESNEAKKYLFIFLFMTIPFMYQSIFYNHVEDRYLMNAFPAFFIALSLGLVGIKDFIKKYSKPIAIIIFAAILLGGAYYQLNLANTSIKAKVTSYQEVKDAGILIKENSNSSAVVMTMSLPQISYYAERKAVVIPENQTDFENEIKTNKPDFLIISVFERHPTWANYTYPREHNNTLMPIKAYYQTVQGQQYPVLVIYKFI